MKLKVSIIELELDDNEVEAPEVEKLQEKVKLLEKELAEARSK